MPKDNGGCAFPVPIVSDSLGNVVNDASGYGVGGMSLRDYFAGQALVGILLASADVYTATVSDVYPITAHAAYSLADAMLAERICGTKDNG